MLKKYMTPTNENRKGPCWTFVVHDLKCFHPWSISSKTELPWQKVMVENCSTHGIWKADNRKEAQKKVPRTTYSHQGYTATYRVMPTRMFYNLQGITQTKQADKINHDKSIFCQLDIQPHLPLPYFISK